MRYTSLLFPEIKAYDGGIPDTDDEVHPVDAAVATK
jgi:hypothetical protein